MNRTVIRATAFTVSVACFGAGSRAAEEPKPSIRSYVRENGSFESITVRSDKQFNLSDLAGQAELVVEASSAFRRTQLDRSETEIFTDYVFTIHEIIKNRRRHDIRAGTSIVVRRDSGAMAIEGFPAIAMESDFPPFDSGTRYILFLKPSDRQTVFQVLGGPQGSFTSGNSITSLATGQPLARGEFLGELRALLKFTE